MFSSPIKHSRLNSLEEILDFSFRTGSHATPLTRCQNNGQIAFSDEYGCVYVTPYRTEIHSILEKSGYTEGSIFVPFSNGEERPEAYQWLAKIAEQENWAYTYEEAYKVSSEKSIMPVKIREKCHIKEIINYFDDTDTQTSYSTLTMQFLSNDSRDNIGTFIIIDEKNLVVCDEYGRTFLLKAKTVVNDLVNALIDAGYSRTVHPEWYVHHIE